MGSKGMGGMSCEGTPKGITYAWLCMCKYRCTNTFHFGFELYFEYLHLHIHSYACISAYMYQHICTYNYIVYVVMYFLMCSWISTHKRHISILVKAQSLHLVYDIWNPVLYLSCIYSCTCVDVCVHSVSVDTSAWVSVCGWNFVPYI